MAGFDVDPATIRQSADELDAAKDDVQTLLDEFTAAVGQYADAFGGDIIGTAGGIAHEVCMGAVTDCFTGIVEDLTGLSEALRGMADDHQAAEEEITQSFTRLQGDLESRPATG
ncbi:hypothetical protein AB0K52_11780 [Glycomyces sp. NPDC049804]|uniref:WXG100 family type VII secretion target n=1 Tax=Glycomyces sp. NPDC049804 TaxID=3154363 RepID=UPI00342591BC